VSSSKNFSQFTDVKVENLRDEVPDIEVAPAVELIAETPAVELVAETPAVLEEPENAISQKADPELADALASEENQPTIEVSQKKVERDSVELQSAPIESAPVVELIAEVVEEPVQTVVQNKK